MSEAKVEQLADCPFCGGGDISHGWSSPGLDGSQCTGQAECHSCDVLIWKPTEAEAIATWNQRAALTAKPDDALRSDANKFAGAMFIASADSEGEILAGDDGDYIYWPKGCHGAFNAWTLRVFADELDRRNAALGGQP